MTDADCANAPPGLTACGTPTVNGIGSVATCVDPLTCGVETELFGVTSSVTCGSGAANLMFMASAFILSLYLAI